MKKSSSQDQDRDKGTRQMTGEWLLCKPSGGTVETKKPVDFSTPNTVFKGALPWERRFQGRSFKIVVGNYKGCE
ncbi:mCG1036128 [Mus musculus]|nr:mCG1036128 [Mus musculus]